MNVRRFRTEWFATGRALAAFLDSRMTTKLAKAKFCICICVVCFTQLQFHCWLFMASADAKWPADQSDGAVRIGSASAGRAELDSRNCWTSAGSHSSSRRPGRRTVKLSVMIFDSPFMGARVAISIFPADEGRADLAPLGLCGETRRSGLQ